MQAKLVTKLPEGPRWLYETKLDGYRAIAIKDGDRVEIRSRNNKDLTAAYPRVYAAMKKLRAKSAVIDGEIVAVDSSGIPSFQALQHRSARTHHQIARPPDKRDGAETHTSCPNSLMWGHLGEGQSELSGEALTELLQEPEANEHVHVFAHDMSTELSFSIVTEKKLEEGGYTELERRVFAEK